MGADYSANRELAGELALLDERGDGGRQREKRDVHDMTVDAARLEARATASIFVSCSCIFRQLLKAVARSPIRAAMERRKEPRIDIDQTVTMTVLGAVDSSPIQVKAVEMSGEGMRILSPVPVKYQAVVEVRTHDMLLLGEVIRTEARDGNHLLAIKLQHSLHSLCDLQRLNQALRWEDREIVPAFMEK